MHTCVGLLRGKYNTSVRDLSNRGGYLLAAWRLPHRVRNRGAGKPLGKVAAAVSESDDLDHVNYIASRFPALLYTGWVVSLVRCGLRCLYTFVFVFNPGGTLTPCSGRKSLFRGCRTVAGIESLQWTSFRSRTRWTRRNGTRSSALSAGVPLER